jgi:hypothetical protein
MTPDETEEKPLPMGISARTGRPLPEVSEEAVQAMLGREKKPPPEFAAMTARSDVASRAFAAAGELDANDLSQAGWAVMFAPGIDPAIKEALKPLLDRRKAQAGDALYKVFEGATGYQAEDTALKWLKRQGVRLDVVDPGLGIPFYLLIVAPPEVIPFEFQYTLDLYWAVGRLWFPSVDQFRRYAESVVRYEDQPEVPTARQTALFAPQHDFDRATQLFVRQVATPLVNGTEVTPPIGRRQKFQLRPFLGEAATKSKLLEIFHGTIPGGSPAVLFSGSHGMQFEPEDARQPAAQGSMVCQDWGGLGSICEREWFAGADLPSDAKVLGLIHFLFACHGAGCPQFDNFDRLNNQPKPVAKQPLLAQLPQALLSHPQGGALAVLGHVERAWAFSFCSDRGGSQIQGFRDVLGRLFRGERIGQATDSFNMRWAALSTELAERQNDREHGEEVGIPELTSLWVARDDARNYIIFGDPAVRLRVEDMPEI